MSGFLKFLLIAGSVGIFTYIVGHIVGWWSGYRTAIYEWEQPASLGEQVHNPAGCSLNGAAHLGPCISPFPAPDTSSYKMEPIREGWPRHL